MRKRGRCCDGSRTANLSWAGTSKSSASSAGKEGSNTVLVLGSHGLFGFVCKGYVHWQCTELKHCRCIAKHCKRFAGKTAQHMSVRHVATPLTTPQRPVSTSLRERPGRL